MKSSGVIRRIDDLGRIVIPKEIRKSLRIREGESLEIYSGNQNEIILRKFSFIESVENFANKICEAFYSSTKKDIIITDNEKAIASAGAFNHKVNGLKISDYLDKVIQKKELFITDSDNFEVFDGMFIKSKMVIKPIDVYGDLIGSIIIISDDKSIEVNKALITYLSNLISRYFEE